jgi:hypothetical protein
VNGVSGHCREATFLGILHKERNSKHENTLSHTLQPLPVSSIGPLYCDPVRRSVGSARLEKGTAFGNKKGSVKWVWA